MHLQPVTLQVASYLQVWHPTLNQAVCTQYTYGNRCFISWKAHCPLLKRLLNTCEHIRNQLSSLNLPGSVNLNLLSSWHAGGFSPLLSLPWEVPLEHHRKPPTFYQRPDPTVNFSSSLFLNVYMCLVSAEKRLGWATRIQDIVEPHALWHCKL